MRGHVKKLKVAFGPTELQKIGAGDVQRFIIQTRDIAQNVTKSVGNISFDFESSCQAGVLDKIPADPELPRAFKKRARHFSLNDTARVIVVSEGEQRAFIGLQRRPDCRPGS